MSTGAFENWAGTIADIGPIYPFVGTEKILVIAGVIFWIWWHVVQAKRENERYEEQKKIFSKDKLRKIIAGEDPEHP